MTIYHGAMAIHMTEITKAIFRTALNKIELWQEDEGEPTPGKWFMNRCGIRNKRELEDLLFENNISL